MKKIKAVQIWYNGNFINATELNLKVINDDLISNAIFYYSLTTIDKNNMSIQLTFGNITMDGKDYQNWQQNQYAWDWAATKLNLELLAE
jgi:hypothetical protein